jgi:hypothetical protein
VRLWQAASSSAARSGLAPPILVVAVLYLAAHLPFLAPTLEDIDSINFALGLHDYDPTNNRPHPPGYPVYIALGRMSLAAVRTISNGVDTARIDALALALLSALAGAVTLIAVARVFQAFSKDGGSAALWAAALFAVSPLFWLTGLRPMSDVPGLALATIAQALLLHGLEDRRALVAGALVAGVAAGLRSQTVWLTMPLLLVAMGIRRREGLVWIVSRPVVALAAGVLVWLVPLTVAVGGIGRYVHALGLQAGDDFAAVDMLWTNPTPRHLARALRDTLILPWSSAALANIVGAMAAIGAAIMCIRDRRGLVLLVIAFGPYAVFHLLFQDTPTVRYALPLLPAMVFLAMRAASAAGRAAPVLAGALIVAASSVGVPGGVAYGHSPHPAFSAIGEMRQRATSAPPAAVFAHHALGRPLQVEAASTLPVVEPPNRFEWLGMVDYWRGGGEGTVWFLADPRRTDLALIDPQSRHDVTPYRWGVAGRAELGGTRPTGADWYRFHPPGWFAGEGWSLSLEAGGVTAATGKGLDHRPIEAFIRRQSTPMWALVGGRDLAAPNTTPSTIELAIDGRTVDTWRFDPAANPNFLRIISLPAGILPGAGSYARLVISARAEAAGTGTPPVAIRQFDIQPASVLMYGFGEGWHEEEYDGDTGQRWRWTSDRSVLHIVPPQTVEVELRGESPLKYFDKPPIVRVTAGGREAGAFAPSSDFTWRVRVAAADLESSNGVITIETDRVYLPGEAEGTGDTRRLGLRLFDVRVYPIIPLIDRGKIGR